MRTTLVALAACLTDPKRGPWGAAAVLVAFAALWALNAAIRNLGGTLHGDMLDEFADSMVVGLGSHKHPPLIYWITRQWFRVMPVEPWAFYLLSCLNAALGMWAVWCAAGRVVDGRRRVVAVALLGLLPVFTVHAATFNHNTLQLSLWPLVALSFLVSIERRNPIWAVVFGVMSGVALLGKYYAAWVILACAMAAVLHPGRRRYFLSSRPYLAAATCCAVVAPHIVWLIHEQAAPLTRLAQFAGQSPLAVLIASVRYLGAFVAYLLPALLAILILQRPSARSLAQGWPPMRRVVACIALVPIVLPALLLPLAGIPPGVPWLYPALFFAPLLLVSAPGLPVSRATVVGGLTTASAYAVVCAIISPILMVGTFVTAKSEHVEPLAELARFATKAWRDRTRGPLERVGGSPLLAFGASFYSADHPRAEHRLDQNMITSPTTGAWGERGVLGLCRSNEAWCNDGLRRLLPGAERIEVTLQKSLLWMSRPPTGYVIYLQAPQASVR